MYMEVFRWKVYVWLVLSLWLDQTNATPLYVASQKGHHDIVQTLLGAGAGVNIAGLDVSDVILYVCDSNCYRFC